MKAALFLLAICLATAASLPRQHERIIGGTTTTIQHYPFATSLQITSNLITFRHQCGGTILNNRSILTATHCFPRSPVVRNFRVRVGSSNVSSGGTSINLSQMFGHPSYNTWNHDNDIAVLRTASAIPIGSASIRQGAIAGANTVVPDNVNVIAIGWGQTSFPTGSPSETLRHVTIRSVNQTWCRNAYGGNTITANMLCAMWEGRGSCFGDSGTGLIHNNVVVGVTSFGRECASGRWPGVYARVSRFNAWIRNHA